MYKQDKKVIANDTYVQRRRGSLSNEYLLQLLCHSDWRMHCKELGIKDSVESRFYHSEIIQRSYAFTARLRSFRDFKHKCL